MTAVSSVRPIRSARQVVRDAGAETLPELRAAVDRLPQEVRHLVGVHFGWWDQAGTRLESGAGKAVRPALALLSCEAVGGQRAAGVPAAVAVELVHNASLLHDDVIDGDRLRRGRPALWALLGMPASILAGDALFFLAVQVLHQAPPPLGPSGVGQMTAAVQALIGGELADIRLGNRPEASVEECAVAAAGKTGALLAVSCALGALAGRAEAERVEHFRAFGAHLGAAFQCADDILGIWGEESLIGKPVHSDLRACKVTLPVALALAGSTAQADALRALYRGEAPLDDADCRRAAELIEQTGARQQTLDRARRHTMSALEHLDLARPDPVVRAELTALADLVVGRDH